MGRFAFLPLALLSLQALFTGGRATVSPILLLTCATVIEILT